MTEQVQSTLNNKYDNSDQLTINEKQDKFLASNTGSFNEVVETTKYINYLKALKEIEADESQITIDGIKIPIKSLLPARSQFEEQRLKIIALINSLGVDDAIVKSLQRDFGTESVFELSSAYANYALGRDRADKIYQVLNGKYGENKDSSLFTDLLGTGKPNVDAAKRKAAKEALSSGDIAIGIGASYRKL